MKFYTLLIIDKEDMTRRYTADEIVTVFYIVANFYM